MLLGGIIHDTNAFMFILSRLHHLLFSRVWENHVNEWLSIVASSALVLCYCILELLSWVALISSHLVAVDGSEHQSFWSLVSLVTWCSGEETPWSWECLPPGHPSFEDEFLSVVLDRSEEFDLICSLSGSCCSFKNIFGVYWYWYWPRSYRKAPSGDCNRGMMPGRERGPELGFYPYTVWWQFKDKDEQV